MARESRIKILDGGMGATLESLGYDVGGPLWGGELLLSNHTAITHVHQGYIDAGADIIQMGSYQLYLTPDLSPVEKRDRKKMMEIAMNVALRAAAGGADAAAQSDSPPDVKVALSIGPYGATCVPGREYSGDYPPPYGVSSSSSSSSPTSPSSSTGGRELEEETAEDALTEFHLSRLQEYASNVHWRKLEWIAFETIPLISEVRAIRRAMAQLENLHPEKKKLKWWITCPFPQGRFPPGPPNSPPVEVKNVLAAMLLPLPGDEAPIPHGIGINCTSPSYLPSLSRAFSDALIDLRRSGKITRETEVEWVMYPDGGAVYDPTSKTWTARAYSAESWAEEVASVARDMEALEDGGRRVWKGVVVGGCCKASFPEIRALRDELRGGEGESGNA